MNKKDLFGAVGEISDELITEASDTARVRRAGIMKITAIAATLTIAFGVTAFAAVIAVTRTSHSYNIPDYVSVPDAQTLKGDIGIALSFPDSFSNGYAFAGGYITSNEDDAGGESADIYKGIQCKYEKDGDSLFVFADASKYGAGMEDCETAEVYKGAEIKYLAYTNKLVPPDYKLTGQDKADEASGRYVFTYGSAEVRTTSVQTAGFEYGGLNYSINVTDSPLTKDDIVNTAKEIIDAQK